MSLTARQRMYQKVEAFSVSNLLLVWECLHDGWGLDDMYDADAGITMREWTETIYGELHERRLPTDRAKCRRLHRRIAKSQERIA